MDWRPYHVFGTQLLVWKNMTICAAALTYFITLQLIHPLILLPIYGISSYLLISKVALQEFDTDAVVHLSTGDVMVSILDEILFVLSFVYLMI